MKSAKFLVGNVEQLSYTDIGDIEIYRNQENESVQNVFLLQ